MESKIFNKDQQKKAEFLLENPFSRLSDLLSSDIRELSVAWCFYSGKIEGNTYTYIETQSLLKDDITSPKKYEDAKMLKNLYTAFNSECYLFHRLKEKEIIDERLIFRLHRVISRDLISDEHSGHLRTGPVKIAQTSYIPPKKHVDILREFNEILYQQELFENPLEKAIYLHCNLARLQPFVDGNKRTSRLVEAVTMMNADLIPVYSTREEDIKNYRDSLVHFYETKDYNPYIDYFLNTQIERINAIAPSRFHYGNEEPNIGMKR